MSSPINSCPEGCELHLALAMPYSVVYNFQAAPSGASGSCGVLTADVLHSKASTASRTFLPPSSRRHIQMLRCVFAFGQTRVMAPNLRIFRGTLHRKWDGPRVGPRFTTFNGEPIGLVTSSSRLPQKPGVCGLGWELFWEGCFASLQLLVRTSPKVVVLPPFYLLPAIIAWSIPYLVRSYETPLICLSETM